MSAAGRDPVQTTPGWSAQILQPSRMNILTIVRPAKAGMFSGRQSHRGKSRNPVAWVAFAEETKRMKPTDKAILGMVSESPGRNVSEPRGGLDKINPKAEPSMVGRRLHGMSQAEPTRHVASAGW